MLPEVHKAALRATAKIAFFSTVVGCGGSVDAIPGSTTDSSGSSSGSDQTPTGTASNDYSSRRHDSGIAEASAPDVAQIPDASQAPDVVATDIVACRGELQTIWPDGGSFQWGADAGISDEARACCRLLQSYYDQQATDGGMNAWGWGSDSKLRNPCCEALDWQTGGTCTPWGPPVPPAMSKTAARELLVA
jgi:hypothetical protein